jgi:hypothetical protein
MRLSMSIGKKSQQQQIQLRLGMIIKQKAVDISQTLWVVSWFKWTKYCAISYYQII